ncbi:sodium/hydrogen exchanger family protein [Botrytis cinerea]
MWVTLPAAMIGILMPMALSFSIMGMKFDSIEGSGYPTALAAFSAGVSLCSTSLGSTFIILSSANLQKTPIGTLIAGAAMLDDILVLVMIKIITALGRGQSDFWTIARPAISILVTTAACVEGSILLSAFLAGAVVRYTWQSGSDGENMDMDVDQPTMMFEEYYKPIMDHILVPFFFASIGFSIPVSEMFSGSVLWKGIFYACLMSLAKASMGIVVYFEYFTTRWSHKWTDSKKRTLPIPEELSQQDGSPEEVPANVTINRKLKTNPLISMPL